MVEVVLPPADELGQHCLEHNQKLLATMKEDVHAGRLYELTLEDAKLGRMSHPVPGEWTHPVSTLPSPKCLHAPVQKCDLSSMLLHPRFAVEQGKM